VLLLLLAIPLFHTPSAPAQAQDTNPEPPSSPIHLEVRAGYDGHYRRRQWFPVVVIASNDGPDVRGTLEWRFVGMRESNLFQREIDLPRGARKRLTLNVLTEDFERLGEVRLLSGRKEVSKQQVPLEPFDTDQLIIGVISSDSTLLSSLSTLQLPQVAGASLVRLDPQALPEHARALDVLDVLFLHNISTADLSNQQHAALDMWVHLGGQLVLSGGAQASQTVAGLDTLLPVTLHGLDDDARLTSLLKLIRAQGPAQAQDDMHETLPAQVTVSQVELKPRANDLDGARMLVSHPVGDGQVIFTAFDLAALRGWAPEPTLWAQVLDIKPRLTPAAPPFWSGSNFLVEALNIPELELPSFWMLLCFMAFYIILVGPVNFLVLRRMRREELAWVTVPGLVFLFVAGTYGSSLIMRGTKPETFQLSIVQGFEGKDEGHSASYIGIFSPRRTNYTLTFPGDILVRSLGESDIPETPVVWTDGTTEVRDALIDVSSIRTFVVQQPVTDVPQIETTLAEHEQNSFTIEVHNESPHPLQGAMVVQRTRMAPIGTLEPGDSTSVTLNRRQDWQFPTITDTSTNGLFNRQDILLSLFSYNRSNFSLPTMHNEAEGMFDSKGIYLLAWSEQPVADMHLDGSAIQPESDTLYIIRLDG
jgi:hypothetical protein